jgi:hypothetical protein
MTVRRQRLLLWSTAAIFAATGAVCLAVSVLLPLEAGWQRPQSGAAVGNAVAPARRIPSLEEFARVWDGPLGRSVEVPASQPAASGEAVPAAAAQSSSAAPPAFKLAGTVVERGHSYALLVTPEGRMEVRGVGEESGGARVMEIGKSNVTLRVEGQLVRLELPEVE